MITRVHVNQHVIRRNKKTGENDPPLTIRRGRKREYAHTVTIDGPSTLVYRPTTPLDCGARCWLETESEVRSA